MRKEGRWSGGPVCETPTSPRDWVRGLRGGQAGGIVRPQGRKGKEFNLLTSVSAHELCLFRGSPAFRSPDRIKGT